MNPRLQSTLYAQNVMQFTLLSTAREVDNFMLLSVVSKHIPITHTGVGGKNVGHNL